MNSKSSGRKENQKMKPYLVYQYLLRHSDENHVVSASELVGYLQETCGIDAERRSIYRDVDAINAALWIIENETDITDVELAKDDNYFDLDKAVIYDEHKKGYYIQRRKYEASDIRVISELIYASTYITQSEAERLVDIMKEFVSDQEAEVIKTDALVSDRVRTLSKSTLTNITVLNDAMSKKLNGAPHAPEKVSFKYIKHTVENIDQVVERRKGEKYIVSPHKMVIANGNYYLLGFDDQKKAIRTYRVDRMKDLRRIGEPIEDKEEFSEIDLRNYLHSSFGMFGGKTERVQLRFVNSLFDTVVEKFGTGKSVVYQRDGEHHFTVITDVQISDQFFSWVCGFRKKVKILSPEDVSEAFKTFIIDVSSSYKDV
jgi:predicted DNA-binding transcriptional regulator YafY